MSYFSTLLTSTTSRYASFRRTLLSSSSEDDSSIDDPEDSHVSRVLRAYYTEKNRPFPAWLGTDPRAVTQAQQPQRSFVGSAQGSLRGQSNNAAAAMNTGGGLGELWADGPAGEKPQEESGNLGRGFRKRPALRGSESEGGGQQQHRGEPLNVRQLPSQRAGSYQTQNPYNQPQHQLGQGSSASSVYQGSTGLGGSVQERLKARLGGRPGGTPSPPLSRDGGGSGHEGGFDHDNLGRPYVGAGSTWSGANREYGGGGRDGQKSDEYGRSAYGRGPQRSR